MLKSCLLFAALIFFTTAGWPLHAQQKEDSVQIRDTTAADTTGANAIVRDSIAKKKYNPKIATFRSALIPGWGQATNRKYWKIPLIYGALGTTTWVFFYNLKTYNLLRTAVKVRYGTAAPNQQIDPSLAGLSTASLVQYRSEFRQNIDYSVLFFLLFWALNIVDANVDANLRTFDVSSDVSMKIRPGLNTANNGPGVSFVFFFKDNHHKVLLPLP